MKKNILAAGLVGVLFAAIGVYFGARHFEPVPPQSGAVASLLAQSMPDATGTTQQLSKWKGRALVVNFWATWCAPCVDEMPELSALQTSIASDNIQIIGIGIDSATNITEFASKYKITYPLYVGGVNGTELSRQLGNPTGGLPFTVLIGKDGAVKKTYLGRLKMEELRKDLKRLHEQG
ncbi:TlpA family protein disulfide reductase [Noviherbaspirillum cavernae]|uniref:TlpA family protein disulfide reductase n=1 Tax=Noviherbaspirillum cavernae TaxID=2320862 RepID=A0A418WY23_9BURK|nr:TlpA disulfide reductase family protein [Noviherbaspirillum cavernae]RJG05102.1 TlpA family protein disulfide reductase [Noviherbaspirillum cavernae]